MQRHHLISNHHGDTHAPNELEPARQIDHHYGHEIDIYEIDFVSFHGRIISAHDYDIDKINQGSELHEWIDFVVVQRRKVLWLDIKENLDIYLACGYAKFDCDALFSVLEYKRQQLLTRSTDAIDLTQYVIIGCQEKELHAKIVHRNNNQLYQQRNGQKWRMILDAPNVWSYVLQYITPALLLPHLHNYICNDFRHSGYERYGAISIDQSFFASPQDIVDFIRSLKLRPETLVIINSFTRNVAPITVEGHDNVIMQYDYTLFEEER